MCVCKCICVSVHVRVGMPMFLYVCVYIMCLCVSGHMCMYVFVSQCVGSDPMDSAGDVFPPIVYVLMLL